MYRREFMSIVIPLAVAGPRLLFSSEKPMLTFGVIADPQYADKDTNGSRFYRSSLSKLRVALKELNGENLDFVVTLGDIIDADIQSFEAILPIYETLKVPHHIVLGNHDWDVADEDKNLVLNRMGISKTYYSNVASGWRMIFLDGTEDSLYRYEEGSDKWNRSTTLFDDFVKKGRPQAQPWNGGISDVQFAWLKEELENAKSANEEVIICCHYPILPSGNSHNLWNAEEVVALLDEYDNIVLYMNGHNHKGNYAIQQACHYVNFKGMVETEHETAYAIVKCFSDRVEIKGYGLEPNRQLA